MNRVLNQIYAYCRSVIDATEPYPTAGANGARIVAAKVLGFLGDPEPVVIGTNMTGPVPGRPYPEVDRLALIPTSAIEWPEDDPRDRIPPVRPIQDILHDRRCARPSVANLAAVDSGED